MPSIRIRKNSLLDKKTIITIALKLSALKVKKEMLLQNLGLNSIEEKMPIRDNKKVALLCKISKEYNKFIKMFIKKIGLRALLKH